MASAKKPRKPAPPAPNPAAKDDYVMPPGARQIEFLARYPELRKLFVAHLAKYGSVSGAAAYIRVGTQAIFQFRKRYQWFDDEVKAAVEQHKDLIEKTIHSRAIDGWEEPRFGKHGLIGTVTRYSDQLLIAYARRHIPEYREGDRTTQQVVAKVEHTNRVEVAELTREQRNALRLLLGTPDETEELKQIEATDVSTNGHHQNGTNGTAHA